VKDAQQGGEVPHKIDAKTVATLIVASLEGALMISRLQRNDEALQRVQAHLNRYLEREVVAAS
jgi:TetR/AcrR family transcriptional repressor of nem operon